MAKVYQMNDYLASFAVNSENEMVASGDNCTEIPGLGDHQQSVCSPLRMPGNSEPFPAESASFGQGIYYIDRILIYLATSLFLLTVLAQLDMLR